MSWKDLLNNRSERVLPWYGFKKIHDAERSWIVLGALPPEHGWYCFNTTGSRGAELANPEPQFRDPDWGTGLRKLKGYIVGDRFVSDLAKVVPDPDKLFEQTVKVYCVEPGLVRFARATVVLDREDRLVYLHQEFPTGPEENVTCAFQDRAETVDNILGVTPALDLAFRWVSTQRTRHEAYRQELQRIREEKERKLQEEKHLRELLKDAGTAIGRRALATKDFDAAAREALSVSGAELLDTRPSYHRSEMVVQYRFQHQRFECTVEKDTLRIVDAGICLTDHDTGISGDRLLTLESLPGVLQEAMNLGQLVVWRHVSGD